MVLTKSQILLGKDNVETVELESCNNEKIYLRPLTVAEVNELEELEASAMGIFETTETNNRRQRSQAQTKGKINLAKTTKASSEMKAQAVSLSLNNPKNNDDWTVEDVKEMPRKVFNEIYEHVQEISGMKNIDMDDIDDFHKDE